MVLRRELCSDASVVIIFEGNNPRQVALLPFQLMLDAPEERRNCEGNCDEHERDGEINGQHE